MIRMYRAFIVAVLGLLLVSPSMAAETGEELDPVHHSADGYYLDFEPFGKLELPRIFLVRRADGGLGLDVFPKTKTAVLSGRYLIVPAYEGEELLETPAESFEVTERDIEGSPIEEADALVAGNIHLESELTPAGGGEILVDFSITRHLVFAILGALIVCLIFITLAGRYKRGIGRETAPKGIFQNFFETIIVFIRDEVAKPNLGEEHYRRFLPYLLTVFFFILTCNLLGLVPFGATATSNLMITAVLATFTFVLTQFNGSKDHWMHIVAPPGVPMVIRPILWPVEILGLFTKPIALAIRLFANMTAGHLVILSLIGLIFSFTNLFGEGAGWGVAPVSVAFSLFIYLLEILVSLIQAYIFTILSALFIGMAVAEHHEHEHAAEPHAAERHDPAELTPHLLTGDGAGTRRERIHEPQPVTTGT